MWVAPQWTTFPILSLAFSLSLRNWKSHLEISWNVGMECWSEGADIHTQLMVFYVDNSMCNFMQEAMKEMLKYLYSIIAKKNLAERGNGISPCPLPNVLPQPSPGRRSIVGVLQTLVMQTLLKKQLCKFSAWVTLNLWIAIAGESLLANVYKINLLVRIQLFLFL